MSRLLKLVIFCSIILRVCVLVQGRYLVEVRLFGYNNPTQTCQDCRRPGEQFADPGCCDRPSERPTCNSGLRCDSFFFYCLRTTNSVGRSCSYFGNRTSTANIDDGLINFNQSTVLGLENPLRLPGLTDTYTGVQLYIEIQDEDGDGSHDFIDVVLVDHSLAVGQASQRQNHTGMFGFVTMNLSVTVLCAQNFTGEHCQTSTSGSEGNDRNRNSPGPIIGGILGGMFVLALLTLLVIMGVVFTVRHRKSKDTAIVSNNAAGGGVKIALNQMYNGSLPDQQETGTLPFYEEVDAAMAPKAQLQDMNLSPTDSTRDSVLVDNPIYGDEEISGDGESYTGPVDHSNDPTSSLTNGTDQAHYEEMPDSINPSPDKNRVYDYIDVKL